MADEDLIEDVAEEVEERAEAPVTEEAPEPPVREWTDEEAEEAKMFGWKAPDEWKGEIPPTYIDDPRRYMERAENSRPFRMLKEQSEKREAESREMLRKMEAVTVQQHKTQQAQFERELASIRAEKRAAVEDADVERFDALDKQERDLAPPQAPAQDPEFGRAEVQAYAATENGAWIKNPVLQRQGVELVNAAVASGIALDTPQKQIEYAEAEMRKLAPAYFPQKEEPKPKPQQRVDAGGLAGGAGKGSAYAKLPPDVKAVFKRFVSEGIFEDTKEGREAYADDYNAA